MLWLMVFAELFVSVCAMCHQFCVADLLSLSFLVVYFACLLARLKLVLSHVCLTYGMFTSLFFLFLPLRCLPGW